MYKCFFKRFFDFWISLIAIICISPILIVVTIWLHFANKGAGAFFTQERPGKDGKIFKVIKFKTMTDERDADGNLWLWNDWHEGQQYYEIKYWKPIDQPDPVPEGEW